MRISDAAAGLHFSHSPETARIGFRNQADDKVSAMHCCRRVTASKVRTLEPGSYI
jgi:hypothetical protein